MEKSQVRDQVTRVSNEIDEDNHVHSPEWKPGYAARFPLVGAVAILIALLTTIASVFVLIFSDGKPSREWHLAPNVALSIITPITNIALVTALTSGATIAWWRKAIHGATVGELHQSWMFTTSTLGVISNIARLDVIGIAVLAAKLAVVDGIFFQKATSSYVGQDDPQSVNMLGAATMEFPTTGYVVSEGYAAQTSCNCFMIGDSFTPVVNTWETSNGFFRDYNTLFQECSGVCYTHIDAIGFEIDCSEQVNSTDIAAAPIAAYEASNGTAADASAWTDLPIFNSTFYMSYADQATNYSSIKFSLQYFQSRDPFNPSGESCAGNVSTIQCSLRPAIVRYPITITNFTNPHVTNGVALGGSGMNASSSNSYLQVSNQNYQAYSYTLKQSEGFSVQSYLYPNESTRLNTTTYLGGIANALNQYLSSTATITYAGSASWALKQQGILAQTMMYGPPNMGSCDCSFRNEALDTIISSINQLAFLTATGLIDTSLVTFPKSSSSLLSQFSFPERQPKLNVNTSTTLTVDGVGSNSTTSFRELTGTMQVADITRYKTHYLFLGLGVAFTLLCILLILPLYWRYDEVGRDVSISPIEVASAFGAPILTTKFEDHNGSGSPHATQAQNVTQQSDQQPSIAIQPVASTTISTNHNYSPTASPTSPTITFSNVDDLLATVGGRKVRYGFVDVDEPIMFSPSSPQPPSDSDKPHTSGLSPIVGPAPTRRKSQILRFGSAADGNLRPASRTFSPPSSPKL